MSRQEAAWQSLATAGAVLITFIGVCHEVVGVTLFPWGPAFLGGPIAWHGLGIGAIVVGLLMARGSLGWGRFPVVPFAFIVAAAGLSVAVLTAFLHGEFHLFALTICLAGVTTGIGYRKAAPLILEQKRQAALE